MLAQMVPSAMKRKSVPAQIELDVRRDGVLLSAPKNAKIQFDPVLIKDASELGRFIQASEGDLRRTENDKTIRLTIDKGRFISRKLSDIQLPKSMGENMAAIDMQGATPFDPNEVHLLRGETNQTDSSTRYAIIKKVIVDPIVRQVETSGYRINSIEFQADGETFAANPASLKTVIPLRRGQVMQGNIMKLAISVFLVGILLTLGNVHWRHLEANAALDQAISEESEKASAVRRLIAQRNESLSQLTTVRSEKDGAVPIVVVMEELSRVIPDNTWITDLEINAGVVNISGFSADAAKLIPMLEASEYFQGTTFRSPVLKVNVQVGERFSIVTRTRVEKPSNG